MNQPAAPQKPQRIDQGDKTFKTDISETGEDGTTVREAEVREDDLSEVKPSSPDQSSGA
ncbi:MAG TPA: hypothetical protein VL689_02670 [Paraburkholderia sp.]|jgi:hypothetical protein|nr:hypothetical protein [Paraburkholderia sp.]